MAPRRLPSDDAEVLQIVRRLKSSVAPWLVPLAVWMVWAGGPDAPLARQVGDSARDLSLAGQRALEQGDLGRALATLSAAREAFGNERPLNTFLADFLALHLHNLGVRFNNAGQAERALESFIEALRLRTMVPRLRDVSFRAGLSAAAAAVAEYVAATGPSAKPEIAWSLLERVEPENAHIMAMVAAGRGRALLASDGPDVAGLSRATDLLRRAWELEPKSALRARELAGAMMRLSQAQLRSGELSTAADTMAEGETLLRRALAMEPASPWSQVDLAAHLLRTRRYEEAVSVLTQAESNLQGLLARSAKDPDAPSWSRALAATRENRAVALYNLAVDAINRATFDRVEGFLAGACGAGAGWERACEGLRRKAEERRSAFRQVVESHEKSLAVDPSRAADLLALGDIYANLGDYDRALAYYKRLQALRTEVAGLDDRIAAVADPGKPAERRRVIQVPGGHVDLRYFRDGAGRDLEDAVKAAWLRVEASLGKESLQGPLLVTLYANRRAFRESAGYRVGSLVKGNYSQGSVSVFETSSQTVVEWVSVLTHEVTHHAVEKLSGGAAPRWLSEGVARFVEGESAVVDRQRLARRLAAKELQPLGRLDEAMDASWNDVEFYLDMRDEALLAVEELARRKPAGGLPAILLALRDPGADLDAVLRRLAGASLIQVDDAWRAALAGQVSAAAR